MSVSKKIGDKLHGKLVSQAIKLKKERIEQGEIVPVVPVALVAPVDPIELARERKANMMRIVGKSNLLRKKVIDVVNKVDKKEMAELSKITGLSVKETTAILTNTKQWKGWKKRQKRLIDTVGIISLQKLIKIVNEGRFSPYQAGLMFQILRGQVMRDPVKKSDATTSINIGDNRRVNVYYPNFTPKVTATQFNNEPTEPKEPETV